MNDGTVYYGEVAYLRGSDLFLSLEDVPSNNGDEQQPSPQAVRHGFGIQLYGRNPEAGDKLCYYSGKWDRDQRSGSGGVMIYPDGVSSYTGSFRNDAFNGNGQLTLKCSNQEDTVTSKHSYSGGFKEGKLEGSGSFEHGLTGQKFGPNFANNHFVTTGGAFSKPDTHQNRLDMKKSFYTQKLLLDILNLPSINMQEEFVSKVNNFRQQSLKKQIQEDERVRVYRISGGDLQGELAEALSKSKQANRTPMVISSLESKMNFNILLEALHSDNVNTVYSRDYELRWRRGGEKRFECMSEALESLNDSLVQGKKLVLSVDEMPTQERTKEWREMYDPDIEHLINQQNEPWPSQIWRFSDLKAQDVLIKIGAIQTDDIPQDEATRNEILAERYGQINFDGFNFLLWSKTKVSETQLLAAGQKASKKLTGADEDLKAKEAEKAIENELVAALKGRFEKSLPLNCLDLIYIQSAAVEGFLAKAGEAAE